MTPAAPGPFRAVVWPLALAETIVWAAMFYSFPALLLEWERDLGWSKTELSGAFTLALSLSALLAPAIGRFIDRSLGHLVLTGSAVLGAVCLALLACVTSLWQFYLAWFGIGIAMSGALYEPCFAFLTRTMADRARQAITLVTLIAGFAGTLSFPGTHALLTVTDWRGTVLVLAGFVAAAAVPLFWYACRNVQACGSHNPHGSSARRPAQVFRIMKRATFWLLAIAFAMIALDHGLLLTHLLPLLDERSVGQDAAILAAAMIGPMQVAGRLAMMAAEKHISMLKIGATCFVAMGMAALSLLGSGVIPMLLVTFVLFHGAGYGVTSIVRPVLIADLLGRVNFGLVAGLLAVPFLAASAASPTIAALIWEVGGYDLVLWVAVLATTTGLASLLVAAKLAKNHLEADISET